MKRISLLLTTAIQLFGFGGLCGQAPEIAFTAIPPHGSDANLAGSTAHADPQDQRVVVYIYVNGWWIKPSNSSPVTSIASDGSWTCDITTGGADAFATRIAAYLIPDDFDPPLINGDATLPAALESAALAKVATLRKSPNAFHFSGYDWNVKMTGDFLFGPGPNVFSDRTENVWVDAEGKLHLRITFRDGQWRCAEVISDKSFGFGTYRFYLDSPVDALDPNVVLGIFTWSDDPAFAYREIDVEITRWGNAADPTNAQFVVQPWNHSGNLTRWTIPEGASPTTHSFDWKADRIAFASYDGAYAPPPHAPPTIASWIYDGPDIPLPGDEQIRLNLWLVFGNPPTDGQEAEVVISRFVFIPADIPPPQVNSFTVNTEGALEMDLTGIPQLLYLLESSFDLETWTTADSLIAPEADFSFTPSNESIPPVQFYRLQVPNQ